MALYKFALT